MSIGSCSTHTAARTLARAAKAVASLVVLAAAVGGLPLLLAWATPVIWAATHGDVAHLLDRQDTGSVFVLLLACLGWIGWAQFTFCAARELIAQLRGHTWHAPRGMSTAQRAAALLIGSILILLPANSALASDAHAVPVPTAARHPGQTTQHTAQADRARLVSPASLASTPASRAYTVRASRPAESLWAIAENELGDGERWREIAELNEGRTMRDGTVFTASSFLQPGWQLKMPDTAADPPVVAGGIRAELEDRAPADGQSSGRVVSVRSGDYLSKIARKELGDGDAWPQLFEASRGKPQPHGLPEITDPDVVYAGQHVTVPTDQSGRPSSPDHDREENPEPHAPETSSPGAHHPATTPAPGASAGNTAAPAPSRTRPPAAQSSESGTSSTNPGVLPGRPGQHPSSSSSASPSAPAQPSSTADVSPTSEGPRSTPVGSLVNLRIVLGAGALLAAAITAALALRRTLQRRRRKPGEKIAVTPETSAAEAQLAAAADSDGAARLDRALRTLAHHVLQQADDAVLPPVLAARIGTRTVEMLPEDLVQEPRPPFTPGPRGWWVLPTDAVLIDDDTARDVPAPYPGLVTIGHTQAGDLLLLNLAAVPALLLDGNLVHITEVCTSLALELAMSPWGTDLQVVTVGFGEDLPQLLPTARICHMRQAAHALRDLTERLLEAHQAPEIPQQPYLLLCAAALEEDTAWQFADLIDKTARTMPVTLIAPAGTAAAHFPEAEILNASLNQPQTLSCVGTDITVQRLQHAAYQQIITALKVSEQPPHPAEGPWEDVPDEPDSTPQPQRAASQKDTPAPVAASVPSPAPAPTVSGEVFPALLAASTDPSALHLSSPVPSTRLDDAPAANAEKATFHASPLAATVDAEELAQTQVGAKAEVDEAQTKAEEFVVQEAQDRSVDPHAPEIRVLGPVEVDRVGHAGHGPRMAQLAALLYFRPGRSADVLCADMDPVHPWSASTLNARLQGLRSSLGSDTDGNPYVPRRKSGEDPYRLAPGVRCDWSRFLDLAERGLPLGPAGLNDLEKALALVRGRPFGGRPLPWAEPLQQEMTTRIIDVAHTVATHRTSPGLHHDLSAARRAIATGLDADPTAELLYRAWMRLEAACGNRAGLHTAITRIQQVNQALDCSPETETTQLINDLLHARRSGRTPAS